MADPLQQIYLNACNNGQKHSSPDIHDNIMGWLSNFLSQRKQRVNIGGILSNIAPVTSGVPRAVCLALHSFHYTSTIYLTYSKIMVLFANYLLMMLSSIASQLRPKPNYSLTPRVKKHLHPRKKMLCLLGRDYPLRIS